MNTNIVLTGLMGAGKSTVGRKLVGSLDNYSFIDIDEEIVRREKMSISGIFKLKSEDYFRNLETEVIKEFAKKNNYVISIGGGGFEQEENREVLLENSKVFYLYASVQTLFERIKNDNSRPLLKCENPLQKLSDLLETREKNYKKSHFIIDTTDKMIDDITREILEKI
ncbi:MAG: shikimate kinase [Candidatus Gastranaerophilales bacterium]|nr:shikimate kinase [Candidatus Gastranaerophilales bacterium]